VPGHLAHGHRITGDQPDQAAPSAALRLGIEGQRRVKLELEETLLVPLLPFLKLAAEHMLAESATARIRLVTAVRVVGQVQPACRYRRARHAVTMVVIGGLRPRV
jgi:hypothetical protein